MNVQINGLWGLLVLAADIWAIVNVVQSSESTGTKVVWTLVILLISAVIVAFVDEPVGFTPLPGGGLLTVGGRF